MEKQIIQSMVASVPETRIGYPENDEMIWEETDGGAHFIVARHVIPTTVDKDLEVVSMSISGIPSERLRVVNEFTEALDLGSPMVCDIDSDSINRVDVIMWQVNGDDILGLL